MQKKRLWLDKWLKLKITNPKLLQLEDEVWELSKTYAKSPQLGATLVLYGANGCGKTKTAKCLLRWSRSVAGLLPLATAGAGSRLAISEYAHWPEIVDGFKKQQFSIIEDLIDCEMCVIDDIGAEHDPSGFGREQLYLLLSKREKKWNIITTNITPDQWDAKLERRIASRLFRNATHIDMTSVPDFSTI